VKMEPPCVALSSWGGDCGRKSSCQILVGSPNPHPALTVASVKGLRHLLLCPLLRLQCHISPAQKGHGQSSFLPSPPTASCLPGAQRHGGLMLFFLVKSCAWAHMPASRLDVYGKCQEIFSSPCRAWVQASKSSGLTSCSTQ
jgi:hypothetical protein